MSKRTLKIAGWSVIFALIYIAMITITALVVIGISKLILVLEKADVEWFPVAMLIFGCVFVIYTLMKASVESARSYVEESSHTDSKDNQ